MPSKTYSDLMTDEALEDIATYASGVGPWKNTLVKAKAGASSVRGAPRSRGTHL